MAELSALGIKVTSSGVVKTTNELEKFAKASNAARAAAKTINFKMNTAGLSKALADIQKMEKSLKSLRALGSDIAKVSQDMAKVEIANNKAAISAQNLITATARADAAQRKSADAVIAAASRKNAALETEAQKHERLAAVAERTAARQVAASKRAASVIMSLPAGSGVWDRGLSSRQTDTMRRTVVGNGSSLRALQSDIEGVGKSFKFTAYEGLNFSRQMADVGVTAAMGMSPFIIAVQQGPQLFDILQQAGIRTGATFTEMGKGLMNYVVAGLTKVAGLITPTVILFTALGAAIFGVIRAIGNYRDAMARFEATSIGAGRALGSTAAQMEKMAQAAADAGGRSLSAARESVDAFAAAGIRSEKVIIDLSASVEKYAKLTGQDAAAAQKELANAMKDPIAATDAFTDRLGLLTGAQYEHIRQLAAQGDQERATSELTKILTADLAANADQTIGLARVMNTLGSAVSGVANWFGQLDQRIREAGASYDNWLRKNVGGWAVDLFGTGNRLPPAPNANARRNQDQIAALNASRDLDTQGMQQYNKLLAQQSVLQRGLADTTGLTSVQIKALNHDYKAVTDTIKANKNASGEWITTQEREHLIAKAQTSLAAARTQKEKAAAQQTITRLQLGAKVLTQQERETKALDAYNRVVDKYIKPRKEAVNPLDNILGGVKGAIEVEKARAEALGMTAHAAAELQKKTELLNAIDKARIARTPALTAEVNRLSKAYADAKINADRLAAVQGVIDNSRKESDAIADEIALIGLYGDDLIRARTELQLLTAARNALPKGAELAPEDAKRLGIEAQERAQDEILRDRLLRIEAVKREGELSRAALESEAGGLRLVGKEAIAYAYVQEKLLEYKRQGITLGYAEIANLEEQAEKYADLRIQIDATRQAIEDSREVIGGFFHDWIDGIRNGENIFKSFADAVINGLNRIIDKLLDREIDNLLDNLMGFGGSILGGGRNSYGIKGGNIYAKGGVFGSATPFAKGGAFGTVTPFAKGGAFTNSIVSTPTPFRFANGGKFGEMGEAGPEAIMPLKRGPDGSLGVISHGNDNNLHVSVSVDDGGGLRAFVTNQAGVVVAQSAPVIVDAGSKQAQSRIASKNTRRLA